MSTATKITAAAGLLLVLGLGNALVGAHDDVDRHEAALERLNARVEELQTAAEDAERENLRLRRAARTQEERYAQLAAELERATAQLAALPAREGGSESRAEPSPREGGERVRRVVEATATEGTGWERRVLAALAEEPDSERHAWAIAELVERLRGDPETAEWKWAERTLEGAARDGNIGPEEAARLERAYHGTARGSLAAPGLAAAAAVGWSDDERLEGFLAGIDRGDVHGRLLRILDHHPTEGFSRYVVRLVRDEHDPGVLRCAFDEDRAAAAAHSPETAREVVAAYAERLRDPRLDGRLRQKGYYAIGIAGMQAPIEAADALRELATGLPTDDEWRDRLTQAASLLQSGKARAKQVEKLLD